MTVVAHALIPPDEPERLPASEASLDTPPARLFQPTAESPVQDIAVQFPAEEDDGEPFPPLTVTFHMDDPDLAAAVAEVADLAFVASGIPGLEAFDSALNGTYVWVDGLLSLPVETRGEDFYYNQQVTPQRGRLRRELKSYMTQLPARRAVAEAAVQEVGVADALKRLERSREDVLAEARRYLSLSDRPTAARDVLSGSGRNRLSGPETMGLVADLITIAQARIRLSGLTAARNQAVEKWERDKLGIVADDRARAGVAYRRVTDAEHRQMVEDLAAMGDIESVRDAKQAVVDQRENLALLVSGLAAVRPVLYRLWDTDVPFVALRAIRSSRGGNLQADRAAVLDSTELRNAVVGHLQSTFQAATELTRELKAEPDLVWEYEPLIEDSLIELDVDASEFVARSARERIREEKPWLVLAEWSAFLGYAQLASAVTGAAPAVLAFTVAQAAVDLSAAVMKAFAAAQEQQGVDAFLRPSERLGVPQSYFGPVMDALDVAINVFTPLPVDTKLFREE